jgi:oligo-1,6-glucosidase
MCSVRGRDGSDQPYGHRCGLLSDGAPAHTAALSGPNQWWRSAVVYQIYPRSFADSDGDGIGDLGGIAERLDYLQQLGVDVLWLSPIYPSPHDDNGYDISDYQNVDPTFGTLEQFDRLLGDVHARGMKLVMDLVVNHTSDEHSWFVESRSSRDNPKRDWYWWRDEPNGWTSEFSGPAWELDQQTGQYYLHLFTRKQPDLNWENPEVREAVYAMMRWWLDRGVDGFRMDVINFISKPADFHPEATEARGPIGRDPYVCGPRIHEFLQEMHEQVFAGRGDLLTVGEMPGVTVEEAQRFTDPARRELDMVFQFEHFNIAERKHKWDPFSRHLPDLKRALGRWQDALAETGWNSLFWNNHDTPRAVSHWGDDGEHRVAGAKLLGTVLHLHRGTPYVYQGEELGMTNVAFESIADFRDIESLDRYAAGTADGQTPEHVLRSLRWISRDNARTPMQWDASLNAGFTSGIPWIPVNPNHTEINAAAQVDDPDSIFNHYRKLIAFRHAEPAVAEGDFTMLLPDDERIYAFTRRHGDTELLVIANFSADPVMPDVDPEWAQAEVVIGTPGDGLALGPWEARVYRRSRIRRA